MKGLNGTEQNVGTLQLLLDGAPGNMFDNITINANGIITLDEDTGNAAHNPKVWQYDPFNGDLTQIFESDPALFGNLVPDNQYTAPTAPFGSDKEASGALDVTSLFQDASWYKPGSEVELADYQAHVDYEGDNAYLTEAGQLDLFTSSPVPEPSTWAMMAPGLVGLGFLARRGAKARRCGGVSQRDRTEEMKAAAS